MSNSKIVTDLTERECFEIITSLDFTLQKIENYPHYPSYNFKIQRVSEVESIRTKVRAIRRQLR